MTPRLQFSQVREDPLVDLSVLTSCRQPQRRVLIVASAGCTALSLLTDPSVDQVDAVDVNPVQLALCRLKGAALAALESDDLHMFLGVQPGDPLSLWPRVAVELAPADRMFWDAHRHWLAMGILQAGNYERLFMVWRQFLHAFVVSPERLEALFSGAGPATAQAVFAACDPAFWPVGFTLAFHADLLAAIFGPKATQHADRPYDVYFESVFRRAILARPTVGNYFLSQLLLGRYLSGPEGLPPYLQPRHLAAVRSRLDRLRWNAGTLPAFLTDGEGPDYSLIQVSNIMDWSDAAERQQLGEVILPRLEAGGRLLVRQLNNETPLPIAMTDALHQYPERDRMMLHQDRSFFYNRVMALEKP